MACMNGYDDCKAGVVLIYFVGEFVRIVHLMNLMSDADFIARYL